MKIAIIPASELTTKSLEAGDYVYAYRRRAEAAALRWRNEHDTNKLLSIRGPAFKSLVGEIEVELRRAHEAGQKGR